MPTSLPEVVRITVLTGRGRTDQICLHLSDEVPTAYPEMQYRPVPQLEARTGYGEAWANLVFPGVPVEVIYI